MNNWLKVPNWDSRLNFYVMENQFKPYEWGKHDCVLFTMNGVLATTGVDPIPEYRADPWKTKEEAMALLEAEGGLVAAMDKRFKRRRRQEYWRGDPVLVFDAEGLASLALCTGRSAHAPGQAGVDELLATPMRDAILCWAVN